MDLRVTSCRESCTLTLFHFFCKSFVKWDINHLEKSGIYGWNDRYHVVWSFYIFETLKNKLCRHKALISNTKNHHPNIHFLKWSVTFLILALRSDLISLISRYFLKQMEPRGKKKWYYKHYSFIFKATLWLNTTLQFLMYLIWVLKSHIYMTGLDKIENKGLFEPESLFLLLILIRKVKGNTWLIKHVFSSWSSAEDWPIVMLRQTGEEKVFFGGLNLLYVALKP